MRLLVYSDIHFCSSHPLITLEDISAVHDRLVSFAREYRPEVVLFLGDRYRARQPRDQVRAVADACLRRLAEAQARHGGSVGLLVGNHDRISESVGAGNTYSAVRVFGDVMPTVFLMEEPGVYRPRRDLAIHALPAGFAYDGSKYQAVQGAFNAFVFHGLVRGASYDRDDQVKIKSGLSYADLDNPGWDVVLGGDVHVAQRFDVLKHTVGGYVGSTLRLNEGDGDQKRGFLDVVLEKGSAPTITLIDGGGPTFTRLAIGPDSAAWPVRSYEHEIIIATVQGSAAELRALTDDEVKGWFKQRNAREVVVHRRPAQELPALVRGISAASTPFEDMSSYIRVSDCSGLDQERLLLKAADLLHAAPVERRGLFA